MAIEKIDLSLCNRCGRCVDSCPLDVIRTNPENGVPEIKYPEDCMLCLACERDCPTQAIYVSPAKTVPVILAWG